MSSSKPRVTRLTAYISPPGEFFRFKARLALRGETMHEWANRAVRLENRGLLPSKTRKTETEQT